MLPCSEVEFTDELLSSETESSTKSLVGDMRPDEWRGLPGDDWVLLHERLIPAREEDENVTLMCSLYLFYALNQTDWHAAYLPFSKFLSCSQCSGVNSSSVVAIVMLFPFDRILLLFMASCSECVISTGSVANKTILPPICCGPRLLLAPTVLPPFW